MMVTTKLNVWMSHGDKVSVIPEGFSVTASTPSCPFARFLMKHVVSMVFNSTEVTHTAKGAELLSNFVHGICGCRNLWNSENIIDLRVEQLREQIGDQKVLLGLSGGVDSSVVAALLLQSNW